MAKTTGCLNCKSTWLEVAPIIVETTPGNGLIAWCDECDNYLDLPRKIQLLKQLIDGWVARSPERREEFREILVVAVGNITKQCL